jgi:methyl-accepting chemotaxis protein
MSLRNIKIKTRFALLLGFVGLGFVILSLWSFKTLNELKVNGALYQQIVQNKDLIADVLPPPVYVIESYLLASQLDDQQSPSDLAKSVERLKALKGEYDTRHDFWVAAKLEPEIAEIMLKFAHDPALQFYKVTFDELVPAATSGDKEAFKATMAKLKPIYEAHRQQIDRVVALSTKQAEQAEALAGERIKTAWIIMLAICLLAGLGSVGFALLVLRSVLSPLENAMTAAQQFADGDLRAHIDSSGKDELTELMGSLQQMQTQLTQLISNVVQSSKNLSATSAEIAHGNQDLSDRTESQAGALEETSAAMEEVGVTVRQNAESAKRANNLASNASEVATQGGEVVAQVVSTMREINESSKKIADIIGVIDGIAFQTNILALNAAVEAARAGDHGRGFAVVASEVRSLASRSADAAKEIKTLINDSVDRVGHGSALVDKAGATMADVVDSIKQVSHIVAEIAAASTEQSTAVSEVATAVAQMDISTQQNSAMVEEMAAATAVLKGQAQELVKTAEVFHFNT